MKTAFVVMMLAVMVVSVMSRHFSNRRRPFKDADFVKAFMNDPAPADCQGCFQDCYIPGDPTDQIKTCSQECNCNSNDQADFDDASMNDPAAVACIPGCMAGCTEPGDSEYQLNICRQECEC